MSQEKTNAVPTPFRGLKVLLVDNDAETLLNMASKLEDCSYKVTTTELAMAALSILQDRADHFDLVMADTNMPGMDCFKFIKDVQLIKHVPVILMSSELKKDMVEEAMTKGVCFFLKKPISLKNLKNLWQHVYRKSKCGNTKHGTADNQSQDNQEAESQGEKHGRILELVHKSASQVPESKQVGDSNQVENELDASVAGNSLATSTEICTKRSLSTQDDDGQGDFKKKRTEDEGKETLREACMEREFEKKDPNLMQHQVSSHLQKYGIQSLKTRLNRETLLPSDQSEASEKSTTFNTYSKRELLSVNPSPHPGAGSLERHLNQHRSTELMGDFHKPINRNPKQDELQAFTNSSYFPAALLKLIQETDTKRGPDFCGFSPIPGKVPTDMANVNQKLGYITPLSSTSSPYSLNQKQLHARVRTDERKEERNGAQCSSAN